MQGGNIGLQPEKAVTVSGGVVLTPQIVPGLTLSADWYSINVHGAIDTVDFQTIIDRCLAGQQVYCPQLVFAGGATQPTQVNVFPLNSAVDSISGLDLSATYTHPLLDGAMTWSLNGNYTDQQTRTAQGVTYDRAGALGASPDCLCQRHSQAARHSGRDLSGRLLVADGPRPLHRLGPADQRRRKARPPSNRPRSALLGS